MNHEIDLELLAKYLSGECSDQEVNDVETWMALDEENRQSVEQLRQIWETPPPDIAASSDIERMWEEVADQTSRKSDRTASRSTKVIPLFSSKVLRYAAAIAILVILSVTMIQTIPTLLTTGETQLAELTIPNANQDSITLADGTVVTLDAGSTLRYPKSFVGRTREVELNGEAYFDVAPDQDKPFTIKTALGRVQVLGTEFSVRGWDKNEPLRVVVAEGKVSLASKTDLSQPVILTAGLESAVWSGMIPTEPREADLSTEFSWMQGVRIYSGHTVQTVIFDMQRWYDLNIDFVDSDLLSERVSLRIERDSQTEALDLMAVLTGTSWIQTQEGVQFTR